MFYYSYFINDINQINRPTTDDYKMLYSHLPTEAKAIWAQDKYHAAEINEYLVPTNACIRLYARLPFKEKDFEEEFCFNCGSIINGSIDPYDFDSIVEGLRYFETRRNLYLMDQHNKGFNTTELKHNSNIDSFDITTSNRMTIFNNKCNETEETKPNYKVSESFLKEFYGKDYNYYVKAKNNSLNGVLETFDIHTNVRNKEEWNIKITNWINRNITDLANLGFYATNFPDIIFFDSGFSNATFYPEGSVHSRFVPTTINNNSTKNTTNKVSNVFNFFKKS